MSIVGFSGHSEHEMESLWQGIELFYFLEANEVSLVERAICWIRTDESLVNALERHFGSRLSKNPRDVLVLDQRLLIRVRDLPQGTTEIELSPAILKGWSADEFSAARELDAFLRELSLSSIPKPNDWRAFFRGKIRD
jgi:hypothetical protein